MSKDSELFERKFIPAKTLIIKEDEDANCAYLIQSGHVSVFKDKDGKSVELARLKAGDIFGEMALINNDKRVASVRSLTDCNLIVITRESFQAKLNRSDPTIKAVVNMFSKRMEGVNQTLAGQKSDMESLVNILRGVYKNVLDDVPQMHKRTFQNSVGQKVEEFLEAVEAFKERSHYK